MRLYDSGARQQWRNMIKLRNRKSEQLPKRIPWVFNESDCFDERLRNALEKQSVARMIRVYSLHQSQAQCAQRAWFLLLELGAVFVATAVAATVVAAAAADAVDAAVAERRLVHISVACTNQSDDGAAVACCATAVSQR